MRRVLGRPLDQTIPAENKALLADRMVLDSASHRQRLMLKQEIIVTIVRIDYAARISHCCAPSSTVKCALLGCDFHLPRHKVTSGPPVSEIQVVTSQRFTRPEGTVLRACQGRARMAVVNLPPNGLACVSVMARLGTDRDRRPAGWQVPFV